MRYVLAILLPFLGMLSVGKVFQAVLCGLLMLTFIGWPVASIWAVLVVAGAKADKRTDRIISAMEEHTEQQARIAAASRGPAAR